MAKSLEVHRDHCRLAGRSVHFAATAALVAQPVIGAAACSQALRLHKAANFAKHNWSASHVSDDAVGSSWYAMSDDWVDFPPLPSGGDLDLVLHDQPIQKSEAIPDLASGLPDVDVHLRCDAPEFVPFMEQHSSFFVDPTSLLEAQNRTIGMLTEKLATTSSSPAVHRRLRALEQQVEVLRQSLGQKVQEVVETRVHEAICESTKFVKLETEIASLRIEDSRLHALEESTSTLACELPLVKKATEAVLLEFGSSHGKHVTSVMTKHTDLLESMLQSVDSRLCDLERFFVF